MRSANIDAIVASLRNCSLASAGGDGGERSPPHPADFVAVGEITVDLNSESALPCYWEQRLDMRTGELYYINWETGTKTTADPRAAAAAPANSSDEEATSEEYSCVSCNGSADSDDEDDDHSDSSSSVSSTSPSHPSVSAHVLVAAGCKGCFMYFMVPKHVDACPKCGGGLLHLGRNDSN